MIWADRVGIAWAVVVLGLAAMLAQPETFWPAFGELVGYIILPTWVLLRLVDWVGGGPARRSVQRW